MLEQVFGGGPESCPSSQTHTEPNRIKEETLESGGSLQRKLNFRLRTGKTNHYWYCIVLCNVMGTFFNSDIVTKEVHYITLKCNTSNRFVGGETQRGSQQCIFDLF